jgi:probable phosphoglycerate mutase
MAGTLFHLVRHASHDLLGRVLVGRGPAPINARGQREMAAVAGALAGAGLVAVVSSPQERAVEMANAIAARAGLTADVEPGLDEVDMGAWTGVPFDMLHADPRWRAFNVFRGSAPVPGGEMMLEVQARAVSAVLRLRQDYPDGALALVSHGDVIKAILAHFLGMPLDMMRRIDLAPASRSAVEIYDEEAMVRAVNLPPPGRSLRSAAMPAMTAGQSPSVGWR